MKKALLILLALCLSAGMYAQEREKIAKSKNDLTAGAPADTSKKHWVVEGTGSLAFTQASFTNWAAGGTNSLGLVAWINFKANYRNGRHVWANNIDLGYGFNILGKGSDAEYNKTNDKIELTTAYGYELDKKSHWYLTVLANFRTQFSDGFNYPDDSTVISTFMAPGYLVAGVGITYAPVSWFNVYLSPFSSRFTFVIDTALSNAGSFGVDKGKTMRGEFGPYLRAYINKDIMKNVNITSTAEFYTDYLHEFGNIDVNWSLLVSMKVNKWLSASIQTQLIYDNDVDIKFDPDKSPGPRTQFKELFGIGLTYTLK